MSTDEIVSLDRLAVNVRELLFENAFPASCTVKRNCALFHLILVVFASTTCHRQRNIVVAVHKDALDLASVRSPVVRKHIEPRIGKRLHLVGNAKIAQVTCRNHRIRSLIAEKLQRLAPELSEILVLASVEKPYVDVRRHTKNKIRLTRKIFSVLCCKHDSGTADRKSGQRE